MSILAIFINSNVHAQSINQYIKGHLSGSFENYSQYYMKDEKIGAFLPPDKFGSNSFLKLDYNYGDFSAGLQYESYLPPVLGFFPIPVENKSKIVNKYFKYTKEKFSIQVGDFYEQFGNGLIFRAYENRQIGINNAMEGANIFVQPTKFMKLKAIYGRTRKVYDYANSISRGLDAEIDINQMFGIKESNTSMSVGGSYVGRYQEYSGPIDNFPANVDAFAGRFDITANNFTLSGEYVEKSEDPHLLNNQSFEKGKAMQINAGFTKNNFGATVTLRSLSNMDYRAEREGEFCSIAPLN